MSYNNHLQAKPTRQTMGYNTHTSCLSNVRPAYVRRMPGEEGTRQGSNSFCTALEEDTSGVLRPTSAPPVFVCEASPFGFYILWTISLFNSLIPHMQMIANMWGFLCAQTESVIICQQGRSHSSHRMCDQIHTHIRHSYPLMCLPRVCFMLVT